MTIPEFFGTNSCSDQICSSDEEPNIVENSQSETIIDISINFLFTKSYPLNVKLKRSIRRRASTLDLGWPYIHKFEKKTRKSYCIP